MSIRFAVLGSGSGGNSTLVLLEGASTRTCMLIDAGFSPRETAKRLRAFDLTLDDIDDVLITHLDRDHFRPGWAKAARRCNVRIHMHRRHYRRMPWHRDMGAQAVAFDDGFTLGSNVAEVRFVHCAHDALGSVGYVIEHAGERLGLATDLGRVSDCMIDAFDGLDHLLIESNYDRHMQLASPRPAYLKRRIMGGSGHLSNEQSLDAVLRIATHSRLRHIALLHLSRDCNRPELIEQLYDRRARTLLDHLTISNQFEPTLLLDADTPPADLSTEPVYEQGLLFA